MKNFPMRVRAEKEKIWEKEVNVGLNFIKTPSYLSTYSYTDDFLNAPVCVRKYAQSNFANLCIIGNTDFRSPKCFYVLDMQINGQPDSSAGWYVPAHIYSLGCTLGEFVQNPYYYFAKTSFAFCAYTKDYSGWRGEKMIGE